MGLRATGRSFAGQMVTAFPTRRMFPSSGARRRTSPGSRRFRAKGWSSPILVDGKLYLTTAVAGEDEEAVSLRAICVDAADGRIVWNVEALSADPKEAAKVHTKNRRASSTPVVDGGRLFVHFGHMGTAALDLNGQVLWQQQKVKYSPVHGNGGSPALVDGLLVFSCDGAADPFVVALDQSNGEERWRTPRNTTASKTFSFSTPIVIPVDGVQQVISAGSGFVGAYDPHDGREIWRVRLRRRLFRRATAGVRRWTAVRRHRFQSGAALGNRSGGGQRGLEGRRGLVVRTRRVADALAACGRERGVFRCR